jgi:nitrite reductase/ring-hydroxylating ferredoxin subunit
MTAIEMRPARAQSGSEAISYHCSWFLVALSSELDSGAVIGRDFLGTRVVAYRGADGSPVVQNGWCPHLGADLSVGQVIAGRLRCAYHHWSFDAAGRCVHIPTGDKVPPGARIATFPAAEAWGLIWVFNGETLLFGIANARCRRSGTRIRSAVARHSADPSLGGDQQRNRLSASSDASRPCHDGARHAGGA